ncbi:MAG: single-stranded DNA-binding protein [Candidatus Promineifilaceae bacterium]|nr:single-stranded DNA-binding protein [Candidatus Promineifilaceae bacterium]
MYQKIIIVGNLGTDPEMRYMPDGTAVTNFSVATNRRWTDRNSGEPREETTWFRVSVWRRQAETANQYLSKGRRVLIEGRLRPDPQTGSPRTFQRQDGTVGASYDLTADSVQFLGGRDEGEFEGGDFEGGAQEEDEIPF